MPTVVVSKNRLTPEQVEQLRVCGLSESEIGVIGGVTQQSIHACLKAYSPELVNAKELLENTPHYLSISLAMSYSHLMKQQQKVLQAFEDDSVTAKDVNILRQFASEVRDMNSHLRTIEGKATHSIEHHFEIYLKADSLPPTNKALSPQAMGALTHQGLDDPLSRLSEPIDTTASSGRVGDTVSSDLAIHSDSSSLTYTPTMEPETP